MWNQWDYGNSIRSTLSCWQQVPCPCGLTLMNCVYCWIYKTETWKGNDRLFYFILCYKIKLPAVVLHPTLSFFPTHWFCLLTMNSMYNNLLFDGPSFWYLWSYYDMENDTLAFNKVDVFLPNKIYYHGSLKSFLQITKWNGPEVHIWFFVSGMFQ